MIAPLREPPIAPVPRSTPALRKARRLVAEAILPPRVEVPPLPTIANWKAWLMASWVAFVAAVWLAVMAGLGK